MPMAGLGFLYVSILHTLPPSGDRLSIMVVLSCYKCIQETG